MENLHKLNKEDTKNFILAGKSIVTVESAKTGKRFTYMINKKEIDRGNMWFVKTMVNSNEYEYMAFLRDDMILRTSQKSTVNECSKKFIALKFLLEHINNIPNGLNVYHSCQCGRCGRTLTTPESIKLVWVQNVQRKH